MKTTNFTAESAGRLDILISQQENVHSRSYAEKIIKQGLVSVDGTVRSKPSFKVEVGQQVGFELPEVKVDTELQPYEFELNVVHEDEDLIVVDKPAGIVVHPSAGHSNDTLVNALLHRNTSLSEGTHQLRPGIVHRLDRDTSGLIVIAKNDAAHAFLAKQFEERTVDRNYLAIVLRTPAPQTIVSWLDRHQKDRKKFASIRNSARQVIRDEDPGHGKRAVTHILASKELGSGLAVTKLKLDTGRTHQIRVHLTELGHRIVGDEFYGFQSKVLRGRQLRETIDSLGRFCLHAYTLGFEHPKGGERLFFTSPWPDDLGFFKTEFEWTEEELDAT